jgi:hypothetical protein
MIKKFISSLLLFLVFGVVSAGTVQAGTNRIITCDKAGSCHSNTSQPLFEEVAFMPGDSMSRTIEIINNRDESCNLHLKISDKSSSQVVNLSEKIFITISSSKGNHYGNGSQTFADLFAKKDVGMSNLGSHNSRVFLWEAVFDPSAGNEYQGLEAKFDFDFSIECGSSGGGDDDDDDDDDKASPNPTPTSTPAGGQALGVTTEFNPTSSPAPSPSAQPEEDGSVKGATTCSTYKLFLPFILLALQVLVILFVKTALRSKKSLIKPVVLVLATLVSIALYYFLREIECANLNWWSKILNNWYWLIALALSGLVKMFSYAFLEAVEK